MALKRPAVNQVGVVALRILEAIPRYAWTITQQIVKGVPDLNHQTVAAVIRVKLSPKYVKRRRDPTVRKGVHRWQYKRLTM